MLNSLFSKLAHSRDSRITVSAKVVIQVEDQLNEFFASCGGGQCTAVFSTAYFEN
jgi:hypothetical protein